MPTFKGFGAYKVSIFESSSSAYWTAIITQCILLWMVLLFFLWWVNIGLKELYFQYFLHFHQNSVSHNFLILILTPHFYSLNLSLHFSSSVPLFFRASPPAQPFSRFPPDCTSLYIQDCRCCLPLLLWSQSQKTVTENIFGATCIHVAAGSYWSYWFYKGSLMFVSFLPKIHQ